MRKDPSPWRPGHLGPTRKDLSPWRPGHSGRRAPTPWHPAPNGVEQLTRLTDELLPNCRRRGKRAGDGAPTRQSVESVGPWLGGEVSQTAEGRVRSREADVHSARHSVSAKVHDLPTTII
jgi:hypothetical protein